MALEGSIRRHSIPIANSLSTSGHSNPLPTVSISTSGHSNPLPAVSRPAVTLNPLPTVSRPAVTLNPLPTVSRPAVTLNPLPTVSRLAIAPNPLPTVSRPAITLTHCQQSLEQRPALKAGTAMLEGQGGRCSPAESSRPPASGVQH